MRTFNITDKFIFKKISIFTSNQLLNANMNFHLLLNNNFSKKSFITIYNKNSSKRGLFLNKNSFPLLINFPNMHFCEWTRILIPFEKIEMNFCRSSGPGGQNVNKLNTKVEYRFNLNSADWLPNETKERLRDLHSNKINSEGYFILTCQEYRTQVQNKKEAQKKLQEIIDLASIPKKERVIVSFEETEQMEERRIKEKKIRSDVKKMRNNFKDY